MAKILLCIFTLFCVKAFAFLPEYEHFSPSEKAEINSPRLFDGEYASDRLTYRFPLEWIEPWLASGSSFQYGAGSLGPTRFLTRGVLKVRKDLTETLSFQLFYSEHGDLEKARQSLIFEFSNHFTSWLQLSLYGQSATLKREDDFGVATTLHFSKNQNLRLYYTMVDFSLNKRNEGADRYDKTPGSVGAVYRLIDSEEGHFAQLSYRFDKETRYFDPALNRSYGFQWQELEAHARFALSSTDFLQVALTAESGFEEDDVNTDQGITRWETDRLIFILQRHQPLAYIHTYGIKSMYQQWSSAQGNVIHNDWLPHLWGQFYLSQEGATRHAWDWGYEFTWHQGQGDTSLRSTLDTNDKLEHRMNIRYVAGFSDNAEFRVLFTFDLDEFGTGETWEGGSMQYRMTF